MIPDVAASRRYEIVETIGRGGMGEVCLADDLMLHRQVALKFVTAPGETDGLEQPFTSAYEKLRAEFNTSIRMLSDAMREISSATDTVRTGSNEIAAGTDAIATAIR